MVYVIFGVSSSGKTTIGKKISIKLGIPFYDADDFHSNTNIEKMSTGVPLDDHDRLDWLQKVLLKINESNKNNGAIFACSALKEKYREILSGSYKYEVKFIFLKIDKSEAAKRLKIRENHFFPIELLDNQFEILENPSNAIKVNASNDIDLVCEEIYAQIF
jgi:carbohydrate kinase (thermoresistant glucokinase family)